MSKPEIIETARIRMVPPASEHAEDLFAYGRDPRFSRWVGSKPFVAIADARGFLEKLAHENAQGKRCYWVLLDRRSGKAFGTLGLNFIDAPPGVVDFGYGLNPDYWGNGWFREAARQVLEYAFNMGARRVQVMTRADNIRSIESVKRLGFRSEGMLRAYYVNAFGVVDCAVLGLLPEDYVRN